MPKISGDNVSGYRDTFRFFPRQDVFLSDENSFVVFASQSESCLQLSLRTSAQDEGVSNTRNSYSLMNAYQKLKGRPQLTEGKRTKKIDVRFTEDEYKIILALEQEFGITKTELIRQRLLQNGKSIVINAKELIARLDAIGAELGRSGNNINQLARYANILQKKDVLSPVIADHFKQLFEQYNLQQNELTIALRQIIRQMAAK